MNSRFFIADVNKTPERTVKRIVFFIAMIVLTSAPNQAQSLDNDPVNARSQKQELQDFEHSLDKFSYALLVGDVKSAKTIKNRILMTMEREVAQQRRSLRLLTDDQSIADYGVERGSGNSSSLYSKKSGVAGGNDLDRETRELLRKLERLEYLFYEFDTTQLTDRSNRIFNKTKHRKLMYDFRDMMRDEVEKLRGNGQER